MIRVALLHGAIRTACDGRRCRLQVSRRPYWQSNMLPPLSSISLVFAMKSVLADAGLHIVAPEPDRATTSEGWIARCEDNLLVTAHTQDFVRQDQGSSAELLRPRSRRSPHSRRAICVIDLNCGIAAAPRDVVSCLWIIDRRER